MSSTKRILIPAEQAGSFNNNNRMIDFRIDQSYGNVLDLSQSYVLLTTGLSNLPNELYRYGVRFYQDYIGLSTDDKRLALYNVDLVKNCSLRSSSLGVIEDIREDGMLMRTLNGYTKSYDTQNSLQMGLHQVASWTGGLQSPSALSPFLEERRLGSYPSRYVEPHLKIPLSELLGLGSAQIPTQPMGDMTLHLELDDLTRFRTYVVDEVGNYADAVGCEDILTNPANTLEVKTDPANLIRDLGDIKFYVGQRVRVNGTGIAPAINTTITAINLLYVEGATEGESNMSYSITLADAIPPSTNVSIFRGLADDPIVDNINFEVLTAELSLTYLNNVQLEVPSVLEYPTFKTELISVNAERYEKILDIEPECVNVFLLFKTGVQLPSQLAALNSIRLRMDGVDVVNRNINVNYGDTVIAGGLGKIRDALYYDLMNDAFANGGLKLKCVDEAMQPQTPDARSTSSSQRYDDKSTLICIPTYQTPNYKKLQVQLEASANIDRVYVYKHCIESKNL
jgi:hypothetical protein